MKPLTAIVLLLLVVSCSKKNDEPTVDPYDPVGTWEMSKIKLAFSLFGPEVQDTTNLPCIKANRLTIESNGTWSGKYFSDTLCAVYYTMTSSIQWAPGKPTYGGTWTRNSTNFIIKRSDIPDKSWSYRLTNSGGKQFLSYIDTAAFPVQETWYIKK